MPFVDRLRSLVESWVGFVRAAAIVVAGICLLALLGMRDWHRTYAASPAWANAARAERLEWSPLLGVAAERVGTARFRSEASFRRALYSEMDRIIASDDARVEALLPGARESFRLQALVGEGLRKATAARAERLVRELGEPKTGVGSALGARASKPGEHRDESPVGHVAADDASTLDALARMQASLQGEIARREEGRRSAFDAAMPSARPVDGIVARAIGPAIAIRIGDETHSLHAVYVACWYGLEGLVVLLACLVAVPFVLRLAGEGADPGTVRKELSLKVRAWLGGLLGERAAAGAMKVVAAAVVGSLTATGVAAATRGDAPPLAAVMLHDEGPAAMDRAGKRGEAGEPGPRGERGPQGEVGASAGDATSMPAPGDVNVWVYVDSSADVQEHVERLTRQIEGASGRLEVVATISDRLRGDVRLVAAGMGDLRQRIDAVATSDDARWGGQQRRIDGLASTLDRTEKAATDAANGVAGVQEAMQPATAQVSLAAGDLLRTNAIPDGLLVQSAPWSRYTVTSEVVTLVRRALREPDSAEAKDILAALEWMREHRSRDWIGQYRATLRERAHAGAAPPEKVDALLRELLPLILRISRVRR